MTFAGKPAIIASEVKKETRCSSSATTVEYPPGPDGDGKEGSGREHKEQEFSQGKSRIELLVWRLNIKFTT